jgi:DNA-binding beta-propeller fold protein YncE
MTSVQRRSFLALAGGSSVGALLTGCGGGDGYASVSTGGESPMALSEGEAVFTAQGKTHTLLITRHDGTERRYGGVGTGRGRLNAPAGVAMLGGLAYVVETGNHRVQVFDAKGNSLATFGEGVLNYPGGIAAGLGEIFVADSRNGRIAGFSAEGRPTRTFGAGVLSAPRGLQVVADGVLVADPGLRKVLKLGFDGTVRTAFGSDWVLPWDVASDGQFVYVADASRNELGVTDLAGTQAEPIPLEQAPGNVWWARGRLHVLPA